MRSRLGHNPTEVNNTPPLEKCELGKMATACIEVFRHDWLYIQLPLKLSVPQSVFSLLDEYFQFLVPRLDSIDKKLGVLLKIFAFEISLIKM